MEMEMQLELHTYKENCIYISDSMIKNYKMYEIKIKMYQIFYIKRIL